MNPARNSFPLTRAAACISLLATAAAVHAGDRVIYVDDDAPQGGDGSSWQTAFRDLQDALHDGRAGWSRIHIAQGVYRPDRGTGDRSASFTLTSAAQLIGGFAGLGALNPDEKDSSRFISVLSGDLAGDDGPAFQNRDDNAFHVVTIGYPSSYPLLSGLTIWGGAATGLGSAADGAGVYAPAGGFRIDNCIVTECIAHGNGGGVFGGGFTVVSRSNLLNNRAGGSGGGAWIDSGIMERCIVAGNEAGVDGGGMFSAGGNWRRFTSSLFVANVAGQGGGGIAGGSVPSMYALGGDFTGCTIVHNRAQRGGGLWWADPNYYAGLSHCIVRENSATDAATAQAGTDPAFGLRISAWRSNIQHGLLLPGGADFALDNMDADPLFVDASGQDNDPLSWQDNNYRLLTGSPCIDAGEITVPSGFNEPLELDLDGQLRQVSGFCSAIDRHDIGAFEYHPASCANAPRLYVRLDAAPGGDGLSWQTAFTTIEQALEVSGVSEIWVGEGLYTPSIDWKHGLRVARDLTLIGSFAGYETDADQRDIDAHLSVISGDRLMNDHEEPFGWRENSTLLLSIENCRARIDGLVLTAGDSSSSWVDGEAAPIRVRFAEATFVDCRATGNRGMRGGALLAHESVLDMSGCSFDENQSFAYYWGGGGAIYSSNTEVRLDRCRFEGNVTSDSRAVGGAILATGGSLSINLCTFERNKAEAPLSEINYAAGGAIYSNCPTTIHSSVFRGNVARAIPIDDSVDAFAVGGAISSVSSLEVVSCEFTANLAEGRIAEGAAISAWGVDLYLSTIVANKAIGEEMFWPDLPAAAIGGLGAQIESCIVVGNTWNGTESELTQLDHDSRVTSSIIAGWTGEGVSGDAFDVDPRFVDPVGPDGQPGTGDENLALRPNSLAIDAAVPWSFDPINLPPDAAGLPRLHDDPGMPNIGIGEYDFLDIGAYEFQGTSCRADHNGDTAITVPDIFSYLSDWFAQRIEADFDRDRSVEASDLFEWLQAWFAGC